MARVVEAPDEMFDSRPSVFLAGGITGCQDWQTQMIAALKDLDIVLLNPRRAVWPDDPKELRRQIAWERKYLEQASLTLFWFAAETDCPITLFELGHSLGAGRPVVVGAAENYSRRSDLEIQLNLSEPDAGVATSVFELSGWVADWFTQQETKL